jgi:tmRNA-binding protein
VLRFDVDPKDKKVTFAGMVLEGAEVAAASGKPYSLEEAMTTMREHRSETYGLDSSDDSDS